MTFYIVGFSLLSGRLALGGFIDGVKDGMRTMIGILSTLVRLLASVGILRVSGFPDFLGELLQMPAALLYILPQIVPVVLVHLVSGSAATGLALDIFKEYGIDSSPGLIAFVLMNNTEIVLYCLSVCFDNVGITKTRYILAGGLIATVAGVAASVVSTSAAR